MNILPPPPSSKINPQKLLPGASSRALLPGGGEEEKGGAIVVRAKDLIVIKTKVIQIKDLIKTSTLIKAKEGALLRTEAEEAKAEEKEEELEKKPKEKEDGGKFKFPKLEKPGFFGRIEKFFTNILLGYVAVRLIPYANKLPGIVKAIGGAIDFSTDLFIKMFDGFATFVEWGYKAYDATRGFIKSIGGENFAKAFDKFSGVIDTTLFVLTTIAGDLAMEALTGDDDGPGDFIKDKIKKRFFQQEAGQAAEGVAGEAGAAETAGAGAAEAGGIGAGAIAGIVAGAGLLASALGEGAFQIRKFAIKPIQNLEKEYNADKNPFTKFGRGVVLNMVRPLYGLFSAVGFILDVVGAPFRYAIELLRYPFLSEKDKKTQAYNLAKLDARIREDLRKGLNMLTFGFAFKEKGSFGNIYGDKKAQKEMMGKMAGGGPSPTTRGGKLVGAPVSRTIKKQKTKRSLKVQPTTIKPGKSVGGIDKLQKVFPGDPDKPSKDKVNPLGYMKSSYDKFSGTPGFGGIATLFMKAQLGDKPSNLDYQNAAGGLQAWMQKTFSGDVLRTGGGFAEGGEVDAGMFSDSGDMKNMIAKSVQDSVAPKIDDTINDLMKQLGLKEIDRGKKPGEGPGAEDEQPGSPTLTGNTNAEKVFNYLKDKEGFIAQAAAGVIGNLMQESHVDPKSHQGGGGVGRGIMQWSEGERWASLTAWAKNSNKDPWELDTQVEWMMKEMKQRGTYNRLKGISSVKAATDLFEKEMEGAGTPMMENRYKFAADALASFGGGAGGSGAPGGGSFTFAGGGDAKKGNKLASELGFYLKKNLNPPLGGFGSGVHQHPDHPAWSPESGHSSPNSLHYRHMGARAIDIGGYGKSKGYDDQDKINFWVRKFNQEKGVKPVEWLMDGFPGHSDHVHVAYGRGGRVSKPTTALVGEKGPEFVFDADTTKALSSFAPGLLEKLNFASTKSQVASILQSYATYEHGAEQVVHVAAPEPQVIPMMMPVPMGGGSSGGGGGGSSSSRDSLAHGH